MTYRILFPTRDYLWLESLIESSAKPSWSRLWKASDDDAARLDKRLSFAFQNHHGVREYDLPLTNVKDLFDRFPHWAIRLHQIYAEAEDPTPTSFLGRWSERRRGPRHTYWVTVLALVLASFFAFAALTLGGVQVWISYCQWQGPGGDAGFACRTQFPEPTSTTGNTGLTSSQQ